MNGFLNAVLVQSVLVRYGVPERSRIRRPRGTATWPPWRTRGAWRSNQRANTNWCWLAPAAPYMETGLAIRCLRPKDSSKNSLARYQSWRGAKSPDSCKPCGFRAWSRGTEERRSPQSLPMSIANDESSETFALDFSETGFKRKSWISGEIANRLESPE